MTGKKMSAEENMERINPSYNSGNEMFKINCTACTMAMELRERGYDVHAGTDGEKMLRNYGTYTADRKANWYTGENNPYESSKHYDFDEETGQDGVKQFKNDISKEPNTRGEICTQWKFDGGHSIYYKTDKKGKLSVYDTQVGKKYSDAELDEIFNDSYGITVTRLDNSTPNIQYLKDNNYIR